MPRTPHPRFRACCSQEVAENRNRRAAWIAKAEDLLARTKHPRAEDVLPPYSWLRRATSGAG